MGRWIDLPNSWNPDVKITRILPYQGYALATIDNADPFDTEPGCSATAFRLPAGWQLASADRWEAVNGTRPAESKAIESRRHCLILASCG